MAYNVNYTPPIKAQETDWQIRLFESSSSPTRFPCPAHSKSYYTWIRQLSRLVRSWRILEAIRSGWILYERWTVLIMIYTMLCHHNHSLADGGCDICNKGNSLLIISCSRLLWKEVTNLSEGSRACQGDGWTAWYSLSWYHSNTSSDSRSFKLNRRAQSRWCCEWVVKRKGVCNMLTSYYLIRVCLGNVGFVFGFASAKCLLIGSLLDAQIEEQIHIVRFLKI